MKKRIYRRMPVNDFQPQTISHADLDGKLSFNGLFDGSRLHIERSGTLLGFELVRVDSVLLDPIVDSRRNLVAFVRAVSTQNADSSVFASGIQESKAQVDRRLVIAPALDLQSANIDFGE